MHMKESLIKTLQQQTWIIIYIYISSKLLCTDPCMLSLTLTFKISWELRADSSSSFFQEAATGTSEHIQAWKQQNGMNFLCGNCIVGVFFLCSFSIEVFCWELSSLSKLSLSHSGHQEGDNQTAMNLIFVKATLSQSLVKKSRISLYLSFTKMSHFAVWPTRKDDKIPLPRLKYHRCLRHYSGDWRL